MTIKSIHSVLLSAFVALAIVSAPLITEAATGAPVKKTASKASVKKTASNKTKKKTASAKSGKIKTASAKQATAPLLAAEPVVMRPPASAIGKSPSDVVKDFYAALVGVMKEGNTLQFKGRYEKLKSAVDRAFNTREMMRTASGPTWVKTPTEKQEGLVRAFRGFTVANYASQFKSFDGEAFKVTGEKVGAAENEKIVDTTLTSGDEKRELSYVMRKGDKGWQIVDVYVDGTISEMAARRGEFGSVLRKDGADALLNLLDQKSKAMGEG